MLGNYVFFVDFNPLSLRLSPDYACYILWLYIGKLFHPTWSGVIQNFATNILPFTFHLHKFESIHEYTRITQIHQIRLLKLGWNFWWGVWSVECGLTISLIFEDNEHNLGRYQNNGGGPTNSSTLNIMDMVEHSEYKISIGRWIITFK